MLSFSSSRNVCHGLPGHYGGGLYQPPCDRVPNRRGRQLSTSRTARLYACHQRCAVSPSWDAGLTVSYSASFNLDYPAAPLGLSDPLVIALPPGPGSLGFSPACFGTFHTDLLRACISSDVLAFSISTRVVLPSVLISSA